MLETVVTRFLLCSGSNSWLAGQWGYPKWSKSWQGVLQTSDIEWCLKRVSLQSCQNGSWPGCLHRRTQGHWTCVRRWNPANTFCQSPSPIQEPIAWWYKPCRLVVSGCHEGERASVETSSASSRWSAGFGTTGRCSPSPCPPTATACPGCSLARRLTGSTKAESELMCGFNNSYSC